MELGTHFDSRLESFLLMAKGAKGAAASKLVQDATSAAGVFVFKELLSLPNVKELATNEQHSSSYRLLEIFSYKTYQDYIQNKDTLPALNAAQTTKLKHLSIVTLASERRILPYSMLLKALDMPTIRELEDLIIDAIYLDVLRGKLDQKEQQLEVEYTMGRDLEPGKIEDILAALQDWADTTAAVLCTLDEKISTIASESMAAKAHQEEHDRVYSMNYQDIISSQKDGKSSGKRPLGTSNSMGGGSSSITGALSNALGFGNGGSGGSHYRDDKMDVDEPTESSRKSKKPPQEAKGGTQQRLKRTRGA